MVSTVEEPSQTGRLEAVADAAIAGPGATDAAAAGDPLSQKPENGSSSTSSEAAAEQGAAEKAALPPKSEAPQRSAGKIALIMGSLMVSNDQAVIEKKTQY